MESRACDSGELCLGGMLAAEVMTLPDRVRARCGFFRAHEAWLARVLAEGKAQGTLKFNGTAESAGRAVFATVQGCMLVSRLFQQPPAFCEAIGALYVPCRTEARRAATVPFFLIPAAMRMLAAVFIGAAGPDGGPPSAAIAARPCCRGSACPVRACAAERRSAQR